MTITLELLVDTARHKMEADRRAVSPDELAARMRSSGALEREPGRFATALRGGGTRIIAEVKGASPVDGPIREGYEPAMIACEYEGAGAAAISVLTEETYFGGSLDALHEVAAAVSLPVLRKDFIVDSYQIYQAAVAGAAAVLLIAEAMPPAQLADLVGVARECMLDALVEVHSAASIPAAVATGSGMIGVNNRNLTTMKVNWKHALEVAPMLPPDWLKVAESGISSPGQVAAVGVAGYDAALVGSSLMSAPVPADALRALLGGKS